MLRLFFVSVNSGMGANSHQATLYLVRLASPRRCRCAHQNKKAGYIREKCGHLLRFIILRAKPLIIQSIRLHGNPVADLFPRVQLIILALNGKQTATSIFVVMCPIIFRRLKDLCVFAYERGCQTNPEHSIEQLS